ncbi:hypothetical protein BCEP4_1110050 [Burkholderia cepacia]|nr:hypothetical protein BCEP4_1110050 [Burkholderia cepacia]
MVKRGSARIGIAQKKVAHATLMTDADAPAGRSIEAGAARQRAVVHASVRPTPLDRAAQYTIPDARRTLTACRGIRDVASKKNFA